MASLLSVNGTLKNMFEREDLDQPRGDNYKDLAIGQPIVVRYLHIFVKWGRREGTGEDLMISTFTKTTEEKAAAAEAINYFNPDTTFRSGEFDLVDFGGEVYGHELLYYNKAYLGESIRFTTKIMELDNFDDDELNVLNHGMSSISGLPVFSSYLPYFSIAKNGAGIIQKLINFLNSDDEVLPSHSLDLHFNRHHARHLQSGRVVCIPDRNEKEILGKYQLSTDNRLLALDDGSEFRDASYYVIQINNEKNKLYDHFDHFQNAAELLSKTNRAQSAMGIIPTLIDLATGVNDSTVIAQIEELAFDLEEDDNRKKIKALFKHLTPSIRRLYEPRLKSFLAMNG